MRVHFSTDEQPARDRVRFWFDYFAQQVHSFTPGEIPDAATFRAEASGQITGGFGLLDIETGLETAKRTRADVQRTRRRRSISDDSAGRRSGGPRRGAPGSTSCTSLAISA